MNETWVGLPPGTVATAMAASFAGLALLTAWSLDARFGEPPNAWHPVAWLGRVLAPLGAQLVRWPAAASFVGGASHGVRWLPRWLGPHRLLSPC